MSATTKHRRPRNASAQHAERLLKILPANLARTSDPMLRQRLERAIDALKERRA
jgi:DNA-binding MurR/RpiR family transcriptional regulator